MILSQSDCGSVRHLVTRTALPVRRTWRKASTQTISIQRIRERLEMRLLELGYSQVEQVADQIIRQGQAVQR